MTPERWQQVQRLFQSALELAPDRRPLFLDQTCEGDPWLRAEVEQLIAADEQAGDFIESAVRSGAEMVVETRAESVVGHRIGPYQIRRVLGRGGMSTVYLAVRADDQYQKRVAIKLIKRGMDTDDIIRRFRHERQILASLDHPHIARLLDGGMTDDGLPYFVMDYIEGIPIDEFCDAAQLSIAERLNLFCKVCAAVHHAHQNLVVHRDLKPSNILVTTDGTPKLLDFGIAKLLNPELSGQTVAPTATEWRLMTPEYASPEQVQGKTITTASDVYSLGVLLYELLTGHRPYRFASRSPHEVERIISTAEPEKPSDSIADYGLRIADSKSRRPLISRFKTWRWFVTSNPQSTIRTPQSLRGDLDNIVLMALRKEPSRRYRSVEQFSEDIERYLDERPVIARQDTLGYRARKFIQRNKLAVSATAIIALLIIGSAISTAVQSARTARERAKAEQVSAFLVNLFGVVDPDQASSSLLSARDLLDEGAKRAATELKNQPDVQAAVLDALGQGYQKIGLYDPAASLLEQALSLRRQALGADHPDVATNMIHLASVFRDKANYAEAERLLRDAVALRRRQLGVTHPEVAVSLSELAGLLQERGDYAQAEQFIREALSLRRQTLGADHPDVADSLSDLANVLEYKGSYDDAEQLHRDALALRRRTLGVEHPKVADSLNDLAIVLQEKGDFAGTESLYRESIELSRRRLGDGHPDVVISMINLASLLQDRGDYAEAEQFYRDVLTLQRKRLGQDHPNVADGLNNLASVLQDKGDHAAAEQLYRQSLELTRQRLGAEHPEMPLTMHNLASLLCDTGDLAEAERLYRQALDIQRRILPPGHQDFGYTLVGLGRVLTERGQARDAEPLLRQGLSLWQQARPSGHWRIAAAESTLGACLLTLGRRAEAEPLLTNSYANLKQRFGERNYLTQQALTRLAKLSANVRQ